MTTTKKAPAAKKADKSTAVAEAFDTIKAEVAKITTSEDWMAWLRTATKFHNYSFNNVLLMHIQAAQREMAPLTHVAGYQRWLDLKRQVRKGETGLRILAPVIVKLKEGEKNYPGTKLVGFRLTSVFDYQQTEGEPLPVAPTYSDPTGQAPAGLTEKLTAYATGLGYQVETGWTERQTEGYTTKGRIRISDRIAEGSAHWAAVLIHEIGHAMLHMADDYSYQQHRGQAETEAESIAYVAGTVLGLEMADASFHYVAGWDQNADTLLKVGQVVMASATKIIKACE